MHMSCQHIIRQLSDLPPSHTSWTTVFLPDSCTSLCLNFWLNSRGEFLFRLKYCQWYQVNTQSIKSYNAKTLSDLPNHKCEWCCGPFDFCAHLFRVVFCHLPDYAWQLRSHYHHERNKQSCANVLHCQKERFYSLWLIIFGDTLKGKEETGSSTRR